ncbi:MAG: hypothetical protein ACXVQ4_00465 [Gaiellaceae bacterium]
MIASPQVVHRVQSEGGTLFVWARSARCCSGTLMFLEAGTEAPEREFRAVGGDGFEVLLDTRLARTPDELHVELHGRRKPRLAAYWNGCAYVV